MGTGTQTKREKERISKQIKVKSVFRLGLVAEILSLRRQRQAALCGFKVSPVYSVSGQARSLRDSYLTQTKAKCSWDSNVGTRVPRKEDSKMLSWPPLGLLFYGWPPPLPQKVAANVSVLQRCVEQGWGITNNSWSVSSELPLWVSSGLGKPWKAQHSSSCTSLASLRHSVLFAHPSLAPWLETAQPGSTSMFPAHPSPWTQMRLMRGTAFLWGGWVGFLR